MAIAIMQLCIYNGLPGAQGEQVAHYFEFTFAPRIHVPRVKLWLQGPTVWADWR